MSGFKDWSLTKDYNGHLQRIKNIKPFISAQKPRKQSRVLQKFKTNNKNLSQSIVSKKDSNPDIFLNKNHNISLHLPSIYNNQKQLLRKSISERKIKKRQAAIIMQNYHLGKRILNVKPMHTIKLSLLQKDFQKHQDYIKAREHSKQSILKTSQKRLESFLDFTKYKKSISEALKYRAFSQGKYIFSIRINDLKRLCKIEFNKNRLYTLIIKMGKKIFKFQNLSLKDLKKQYEFNFKKKYLKSSAFLFCQLQQIIQNDIKSIGEFIINLSQAYQQMQSNIKDNDFIFERKQEIQGIQSKISQLFVGNIYFDYKIYQVKD